MAKLPEHPTLADFQLYVTRMEEERGFIAESPQDKALLLGEEVGELFKAIRKAEGKGIDLRSRMGSIEGELADILIYLCAIANRYGVDLEQAFRVKEEENSERKWTSSSRSSSADSRVDSRTSSRRHINKRETSI